MNSETSERHRERDPVEISKDVLLEPAPVLMQAYRLSLSGVHDLWRRAAHQHSLLLAKDESVSAALIDGVVRQDGVMSAPSCRPVLSVGQLLAREAHMRYARIPTSLPTLDDALGGGLSPGHLIELTASRVGFGSARQLAQRWASNVFTLRSDPSRSHTSPSSAGAALSGTPGVNAADDHRVYWLTASAGAAAVDVCVPIVAATGVEAASVASRVYVVPVSDVESLEGVVLPAVHEHFMVDRQRRGSAPGGRCLLVVDDLTVLIRRCFPVLWETRALQAGGNRDETFAMHACVQRLVEKLKSLAEITASVCVLLTEQPTASLTAGVAAEESVLGRAFVHGMSLRLFSRDGWWCVRRHTDAAAEAEVQVGRRTEVRVVKSAVCVPFVLLTHITREGPTVHVEEVDVLVSPIPQDSAAVSVSAARGARTQAWLLVSEVFLESLDGWDHASRPHFMMVDA